MKRYQIKRRTSELLPVVHQVRKTGIAALLGGAATLMLVPFAPLYAQTATTEPTQATTGTEEGQEKKTDAQEEVSVDQPSESESAEGAPVEGQIVEQPEGTYQVSELIGSTVASPDGEIIGEVIDVLYTEDESLKGFVIGAGGILGFGKKEIAVEASNVTRMSSPEDGTPLIVVNFTHEQLEQAPEFISLADQRQAEAEESARLELEAQRQEAEQARQQGATTVPTQ